MRFKTVFIALFFISEPAFAQVKDDAKDWKETCLPIQANIHEPLRCRQPANDEGTKFNFDNDCCAGSDKSPLPGICGNGFNRTEKGVCGQEHEWCREHECRHYTCEKRTSCLDYVGCFNDRVDAREFQFKAKQPSNNMPDEKLRVLNNTSACVNYCREEKFAYAAIQGAGTCFCGDAYGKYGNVDDRLCGKKQGGAVALRCGDGNEGTCAGVNAVYRITGEQRCCDYFEAPAEPGDLSWVLGVILVAVIAPVCCLLICGGVPTCIGVCIWLRNKKKHEERQRQRAQQAQAARVTADSNVAIVQPAMAVTVVDPGTQKTNMAAVTPTVPTSVVVVNPQPGVVVEANPQPGVVMVAGAQPASIYPTLET